MFWQTGNRLHYTFSMSFCLPVIIFILYLYISIVMLWILISASFIIYFAFPLPWLNLKTDMQCPVTTKTFWVAVTGKTLCPPTSTDSGWYSSPVFITLEVISPRTYTLHFPILNHTYHFIVQFLLAHDLSAILSSRFVFSANLVPIPPLGPFMN